MSNYYHGDLDADLESIRALGSAEYLDRIGQSIAYGRAQQVLQILWARHLRDKGLPTDGALLPDPYVCLTTITQRTSRAAQPETDPARAARVRVDHHSGP